eukprot:755277-Hanusia_phi.AAC.1
MSGCVAGTQGSLKLRESRRLDSLVRGSCGDRSAFHESRYPFGCGKLASSAALKIERECSIDMRLSGDSNPRVNKPLMPMLFSANWVDTTRFDTIRGPAPPIQGKRVNLQVKEVQPCDAS